MISKSQEDYLKAMYVLKMKNGEIRVTDIAEHLNITKPSVTKAINNMKENKLVNNKTYGKIELTKKGEDIARKVLEAYDISYVFLKDVLGLSSEKAEGEAEKLKLTMEDDTLNSLAKYVHKVLNLSNLDCDYDIAQERCRTCKRRSTVEK